MSESPIGNCEQCGRSKPLVSDDSGSVLCFTCSNGGVVTSTGSDRYALGKWSTEDDSARAFDDHVSRSGIWERTFKEVRGYSLAPRLNRESKDLRIDRVLIPGEPLRRAGWTHVVGVELKRSGRYVNGHLEREPLGKPLAQAIDYTYAAWNVGIYWMMCEYVFLWPFAKQGGVVESIMAQNRVGVCYEAYGDFVFQLERQVINFDRKGELRVALPSAGRKMGSR